MRKTNVNPPQPQEKSAFGYWQNTLHAQCTKTAGHWHQIPWGNTVHKQSIACWIHDPLTTRIPAKVTSEPIIPCSAYALYCLGHWEGLRAGLPGWCPTNCRDLLSKQLAPRFDQISLSKWLTDQYWWLVYQHNSQITDTQTSSDESRNRSGS